jgi:FAD/FMN-containing dehydrogenase
MAAMQIEQLRSALRGAIVTSGDESYESARRVHNAMIDKRPRLIVQCRDVADVIAAVDYGRTNQVLTAIRGGGHNGGGLGTCDDGLVIDLSMMRGVRVDQAARTVRVAGGALWGDVDHATHPFGLAVPSGFISSTGVGGLTLGGGIGYLTRAYGLTIDNLLSVDAVQAYGGVVSADAAQHRVRGWALRGGGG